MNQPAQLGLDALAIPADAECPRQADTDPFFSTTLNVPSGPVDALGIDVPADDSSQTASRKSNRVARQEPEPELLNGIDLHLFRLEIPDDEESEVPMPIRGAFCVDMPESSPSIDPDTVPSVTIAPTTGRSPQVVVQDAVGRFIARDNSVIHIDGNEGFDYIDLSDRDIAHVTFSDSSLTVVDATTNVSFTIRHQNINRALFSNGQMIELD